MKFCQALIGLPAEWYVPVSVAAEAAGFDMVGLSDHVIHPESLASNYPYTPDGKPQYEPEWDFPDCWVTVGAMASATSRLQFVTNVYVLPARNPLVVAKAVGTAAVLSGGRVLLGVGAGWMREEFEALGQSFEARGRRMDETIDVLRSLWTDGSVEYHGDQIDLPALAMRPGPERRVPVLVGGHSSVALRRAARNDGWIGVNYTLDQLEEYCTIIHGLRSEAGMSAAPFEIVASPLAVPDARTVERLESMGVSTIMTSAWIAQRRGVPTLLDEAIECVTSYGEQWIAPLR